VTTAAAPTAQGCRTDSAIVVATPPPVSRGRERTTPIVLSTPDEVVGVAVELLEPDEHATVSAVNATR
jgi:hypothetical protein